MHTPLSAELFWLTLTIILTAIIWIPYIINRLIEHSPWPALMNRNQTFGLKRNGRNA